MLPHMSSQTSITDATAKVVPSTESVYDHMVELEDNLWFHWNDVVADSFQGRLVHTADSEEQAPSWLGFGVYHDNQSYKVLPTASDPFMTGSTCIIGIVTESEVPSPAQFYYLSAQSVEGITLNANDTSYSYAFIVRHDKNDGRVITYLSFTKNIVQSDDDSSLMGGNIRQEGVNVFLWAVGPATEGSAETNALGHHSMKGVIFLDLFAVQKSIESPLQPVHTAPASDETAGNTVSIVRGQCGSSIIDGNDAGYVALSQNLEFHWKLVGRGTKIQIALSYTGNEAWLGVATSTNGRMVGSSAVIGSLGDNEFVGIPPRHYNLKDQDISGVTADTSVLLEHASIASFASSTDVSKVTTVLQFTRNLNLPSDFIETESRRVTFLYAVGASMELAYHEHRGSFQLNLEDCGGVVVDSGTWARAGIFATHGIFAALAWAVVTPVAVSATWLRSLVPASWIYIHVFGNIVSFLATLIAFIVVVMGVAVEDAADHFSKTHHWVGLVLLVLATFQVINGLLRPPAQRKENSRLEAPNSATISGIVPVCWTPRDVWKLVHRLAGLATTVLGIYQIHSGLGLYSLQFRTTSLVKWFRLYTGGFVLGLLGLKLWVRIREGRGRSGGIMQAVSTTDRDEGMDGEVEPEPGLPDQTTNDAPAGTFS